MRLVPSPIESLNQPFAQQSPEEFEWLSQFVRGAHSILEIGSCFGQSLRMFAALAAPGARICSIDLGYGTHALHGVDTGSYLLKVINDLRAEGFEAYYLFSDSRDRAAKLWAAALAPFDFVFIDGDHDYRGVRSDWENYGPLGRIVAFHDIVYEGHDVRRVWQEIKSNEAYRTYEKVSSRMGTGVVDRSSGVTPRAAAVTTG